MEIFLINRVQGSKFGYLYCVEREVNLNKFIYGLRVEVNGLVCQLGFWKEKDGNIGDEIREEGDQVNETEKKV